MSFDSLDLKPELLRAIESQGFTAPTPIQTQVIPIVFKGGDLLASAQTGTGKTAAFALPIVQQLSEAIPNRKQRHPRALVLVPTRELAAQVSEHMQNYGRRLSLRSTMIYGGVNIQAQIERLKRGIDIVVATPGRLLDHASRGTIDLSRIEFLVLDEADRMLDLGFIDDIKAVAEYLPDEHQTLLFSATFSRSIKRLADELLDQPQRIEVERRSLTADEVTHSVYPVPRNRKRDVLTHLINKHEWSQVLVFARTRYSADQLTAELQFDGIDCAAIHSNKSQSIRTRTLKQFKNRELRVLVATDVAARGLDIAHLPHVINYELPDVAEDYVHRIGRTGRAGVPGIAISLMCPAEESKLKAIESLLKTTIAREMLEDFKQIPVRTGMVAKARKKGPSKPSAKKLAARAKAAEPRKKKTEDKPKKVQKSTKSRRPGGKKTAPAPQPAKTGRRGQRS